MGQCNYYTVDQTVKKKKKGGAGEISQQNLTTGKNKDCTELYFGQLHNH